MAHNKNPKGMGFKNEYPFPYNSILHNINYSTIITIE
jgi:hypothetical protein